MLDGNSVFALERAPGYLMQLATAKAVNRKFGSYEL